MPIQVNPGPLPEDGSRIAAPSVLEAFVNGTDLSNFNNENFLSQNISFFVSQTDAPASLTHSRALSWFARGEGRLYHRWYFTPASGPDSGVTLGFWVGASGDRKEMVAEARYPVAAGEPVFVDATSGENHFRKGLFDTWIPIVSGELYTSHTSISLTSDAGASVLGFWAGRHRDPCFVALESSSSWSGANYIKVVDIGYCSARVTGYTAPGSRLVTQFGLTDATFLMDTGATVRVTEPLCAIGADSAASAGSAAVDVFLLPTMSHRDH